MRTYTFREWVLTIILFALIVFSMSLVATTDVRVQTLDGRHWTCDFYSKGAAYGCIADDNGEHVFMLVPVTWPQFIPVQ